MSVHRFSENGFEVAFQRKVVGAHELRRIYQGHITQPVLFVGGAREAAVQFGKLEPMQHALPNLRRIVILEGAGHWVQQERAETVNRELIDFLDREVSGRKNHSEEREPS